jgi:cell division protein DivIC
MFLVALVVFLVMAVVTVKRGELEQKIQEHTAKEEKLLKQLEAEQTRAEEIEEYRKYTQTKKFVEEIAKDKLGLVYEDEILFRAEK